MPFTFEDHTADIYLVAEAPTPGDLVVETAAGLIHLIWEDAPPRPTSVRPVVVTGEGEADLLARFLTEILGLVDMPEGWPCMARRCRFSGNSLEGEVGFVSRGSGARPRGREVKAVSFRDLEFGPTADGRFRARILLDI